ncbi:MAG: aminopeptidase [Kofleriaceae bacterium]|nr:aminopeptidase [Kofleriaceae bacterium]
MSGLRRLAVATVVAVAVAATVGGCLMPRYLAQAAYGQLDLLRKARPIDDAIRDPDVPLAIRELLAEVPAIKAWARQAGLSATRNYNTYVQLDHDYAVYFVGVAPRLSLTPLRWCFPIAGCFTGLGWFDEDDAIAQRDEMEARGFDAMARPASAYSTGGWFPDPLLSTMLPDGDPRTGDEQTGYADLANVVIHESVHATVLVPDQPFFNEGIAEYIGDALADELLVEKFGEDSAEVAAYRADQAWRRTRTERMLKAYKDLEALYASATPDAEKLKAKAAIIDGLVADLGLWHRPNNANLVEVRVYTASYDGFAAVHQACGSLRAMISAGKRLGRGDFEKRLQEDLGPVLDRMKALCRKP